MEGNIKPNQEPISSDRVTSGSGESPEQRIAELGTALEVVKKNFCSYGIKLKIQARIWALICSLIIITCICLSSHLLKESFPEKWTWQIVYISIIRITIATAIFTLASFCFKVFQSYVHLNEQNSHNITVIQSMASLVGAAKDEAQRNLIYGKLIDIIIHMGDTGFAKKQDFKGFSHSSIEAIQKILATKNE